MLLRAEGVSKSFGPKEVLRSAAMQVEKGEKFGLVGRNGSGKTTLLKILLGVVKPDMGDISLRTERVSYLPQLPSIPPEATVGQTIATLDARQAAALERIVELESLMAAAQTHDELEQITEEYSRLQQERGGVGPHAADHKVREAMSRVGLDEGRKNSKVSELSGGEKTKVFLARILLNVSEADLLFLDEPTSHLDIETVEWLEDYLRGIQGAVIIVSHDRYFLDRVVSGVYELEAGNLSFFTGNYSEYVEKKRVEIERKVIAKEKDRTERARQAKIAEELYRSAWYASTHKTRRKMIERMDEVDGPVEQKEIKISMSAAGKHGRNLISAAGLGATLGGRKILDNIDLELEAGDKLGIIGPNGSGKTTLLRALLGETGTETEGEVWVAPGASVGYFAQGHEVLEGPLTAERHILRIIGPDEHVRARNLLSRFLITGKDADRPISTLSGGERARVAIAMLIAEERNLLILDEPTNYLDIPSRHAVEEALASYGGSLIVVTHDRYFLDSVCNRVGVLENGGLDIYNCDYSNLKTARERRGGPAGGDSEYVVVSGFKEWVSGRTYKPGEAVTVAGQDAYMFKWAIENGKLKRASDVKMKK